MKMFLNHKNKLFKNIRLSIFAESKCKTLKVQPFSMLQLPPKGEIGREKFFAKRRISPFGESWGGDYVKHKSSISFRKCSDKLALHFENARRIFERKSTNSTRRKPEALRYGVITPIFLLMSALTFAQPGDNGLTQEEVDVTKTFDAVLKDVKKYSTSPALPESLSEGERNSVYNLPPKLLLLDYEAPTIRPIAMQRESDRDAQRYWGKIGYGIPNQPYVDFRLHNGKSDWLDFNLQVRHHSAKNTQNIEFQQFGNTDGFIDGTYYARGLAVGGKLGFDLDRHHFYGHADAIDFTKSDVFQQFLTGFGEFRVANSERTLNDINYWLTGDFHTTGDNYLARENRVGFKAGAEKWIDKNRLAIEIDNHYRYFSNDNDTLTARQTNNVLAFKPYFELNAAPFRLKAGAYLGFDDGFVPYPNIEASVQILEGKASIFGGWTGEIQQAQFREFGAYNPYIQSVLALENTRLRNLYGGVKAKIDKLNVEARATQKRIQNLPMYLTNYTDDRRRFDILYDSTATIFAFGGIADFELLENINISFSGTYNIYGSDDPHWHLPTLESNIGLRYSYNDQISLKANAYIEGGSPYLTQEGVEEQLAPLFDFNVGGTYRVNDNFSLFLDLNNLFASKYQRWHRYPQLGLNFVGGVIFEL